MKSSMTEDILTTLGLIHIHYDMPIGKERVIDLFASQNPRKMAFESLLTKTK